MIPYIDKKRKAQTRAEHYTISSLFLPMAIEKTA
jgi:hypothetical protein